MPTGVVFNGRKEQDNRFAAKCHMQYSNISVVKEVAGSSQMTSVTVHVTKQCTIQRKYKDDLQFD
jgi:hypothetical protein